MDFCEYPSEILQKILLYLSGDDIAKFGSTCKSYRSLVNDDYIWKKICLREEITEVRKIEISHRAFGMEKLCEWWATYMESRMYFYFNWKYGRKKVKKFARPYSDYFIAADETGLAIANESGAVSVYDSYMTLLWSTIYDSEMEYLAKWRDTLCIAGEEGITLIKKEKEVHLEIWGDVHYLPKTGTVWVLDDDEGNLAGWCMATLELVAWCDYMSHYSERIFSDDLYVYGLGQSWIACFNSVGRITTTITLEGLIVVRINGNEEAVAALTKTERYSIVVWNRQTSLIWQTIELNRPYCLKLSPTSNLLAYCARDLDLNVFSTFRIDTLEQFSTNLDLENIANAQIYFLTKDIIVLFLRMDWEPAYTRMVVCDESGNILYSSALRVKYILYVDRRKMVLKYNSELQIVYFDHRD